VSRLNLESIEQLADLSFYNKMLTPPIASRCAVFAKTDLIHAQQEGYSLAQICDSLCEGLVKNITDTLFGDVAIRKPLILTGGVSQNKAVIKHLTTVLGTAPVVGTYSYLYGAIGAALLYLNENILNHLSVRNIASLVIKENKKLEYGYPPLELRLSVYPEFASLEKINYMPSRKGDSVVEVDIYKPLTSRDKVYMGIDIGSTSTKAVLIDEENRVLAGFYTMTAGQPLKATQLIFEAINHISLQNNINLIFKGVATTGAGRKFIGKIIGADLMTDEITAHARAAVELDPEVDTIIEIGGQDSKFTTLKNGMVTFCVMNNVCAAGTGSFIAEQAKKLGCPLSEYSKRALKKPSPFSSDRCTVFMERDINYYLGQGYQVDEILASVLHSIRDNYLSKVANEANIGEKIFFQGATAKNKALVAAFENKLKKQIHVSKYCHLTGALGSALILAESNISPSNFRGILLYNEELPVESETCKICHNNCKIKKVLVQNEIVAFGFLCGRDYDTQKFVDNKKGGFDLIKEYKQAFKIKNKPKKYRSNITIGIPHGLYLAEEHALWTHFFNKLGIKTVSSEGVKTATTIGKKVANAEFCTPITTFYGHVKYLSERADYLFLPIYFDSREKEKDVFRQYCYYTQFATSLVSSSKGINVQDRAIMPVIDSNAFLSKVELCKALKPVLNRDYWSIVSAYDEALEFYEENRSRMRNIYQREKEQGQDIKVVLLGRPYTVLDNNMNKGIPGIFAQLNIKAFYHDMLSYAKDDIKEIEPLLKAFHWNYTAKILSAALIVAKTKGIYPVYISSFKCAPDSFALEYFKRIMDAHQKPYIILDLDEHGSNVGYETRIEAAVSAFRNHSVQPKKSITSKNYLSVNPDTVGAIGNKTLLFPSWDNTTVKLIEAVLIKEGIDARMVPIKEHAIQVGLKSNRGQCLPVNIIYQSFVDYIKENDLNPSNTTVWMFNSSLACNIRLYPYLIKSMLESNGNGLEHVSVYAGRLSLFDISIKAAINAYFAYMFGGMLRKMGCKIRPYEKIKGKTDEIIKQSESVFYDAFLGKTPLGKTVVEVVQKFKDIEVEKTTRPKIAIFGDLYVRDNNIINQHLIKCIEQAGGEVITTSIDDLAKMVANKYVKKWLKQGHFKEAITSKGVMMLAGSIKRNYNNYFNEILQEYTAGNAVDLKYITETFNVLLEHAGESMDNLIMIFSLLEQDPDISLFVQTSPAFCCAGLITEAMASNIESVTGIPIVSLTYDGTEKNQNDKLIPYIKLRPSKTLSVKNN
jgi:predicted CoA-substrate-specific enzyme activase